MDLVPNKECGDCSACCHHIPIDQEDFVKLPNIDCVNLRKGGGCNIYKNRPITCATWYCAWRYLPNLNDQWRPDLSGVLMDFSSELIPSEFKKDKALVFKVIDKEKFLLNTELTQFIIYLMNKNLPIFLSHGLEAGYSAISTILNPHLLVAVKERNHKEIRETLKFLIEECEKAPKNRLIIENGHIKSLKP
jgi:Fe-S-cluster containining protein